MATMSDYKEIIYDNKNGVATLTLNRPDKRNALNSDLIDELKIAIIDAESDPSVGVIVLRGAGKDFCAGADLEQIAKISKASVMDNIDDATEFADLIELIRAVKKPVMASVHGRAVAGGAGLASACDLIIATRSATFRYTEVKIGFVPAIVTAIASRNLTQKQAFELLCTAKVLSAKEAQKIGFVNKICIDDKLEIETNNFCAEINKLSQSAISLTKSLLYQTDAMSFEQAIQAGINVNTIARMTDDCKKGIIGFISKNK